MHGLEDEYSNPDPFMDARSTSLNNDDPLESMDVIDGLYCHPDDRFIKLAKEACQHIPTDHEDYEDDIKIYDSNAIMPLVLRLASTLFVTSFKTRVTPSAFLFNQAFQNTFQLPNIEHTANWLKCHTLDIFHMLFFH